MSGVTRYIKNNKFEKYSLLIGNEKKNVDTIVADFIQELVTKRGTNAFDRSYGTDFFEQISDITNKEKIDYFLKHEADIILKKYGIISVSVDSVLMNTPSSSMDISIYVEFDNYLVDASFDFSYAGRFVDGDLLEL